MALCGYTILEFYKKQGLDLRADLKKVPDNNQYLFSAIAR